MYTTQQKREGPVGTVLSICARECTPGLGHLSPRPPFGDSSCLSKRVRSDGRQFSLLLGIP